MERYFDTELKELKNLLLQMSASVEDCISLSVKALVERQEDIAHDVIRKDDAIDRLNIDIDEFCIKLLVLRQPAATDLRFITSAMKISKNLERIADQAVNIANRTLVIITQPLLKPLIDIPRIAVLAQKMVKDSIDSLVNKDEALAVDVYKRDDAVDNLNDQIFRELLTYMIQDTRTITRAIELMLVGRHLERIADLATNIAEDTYYFLTGKAIK